MCGDGSAPQVALGVIAAEAGEFGELFGALHALGGGQHSELAGEADCGGYQRPIVRVIDHPGDERAVDLEHAERLLAQLGQ